MVLMVILSDKSSLGLKFGKCVKVKTGPPTFEALAFKYHGLTAAIRNLENNVVRKKKFKHYIIVSNKYINYMKLVF